MTTSVEHHAREPLTAVVRLRDDLRITPDVSRDPPCYIIEDALRGKFYRVGVAEYTLFSLLDGRTPLTEAIGHAAQKLGPDALAEHEALAACRWLLDCELAHAVGGDQTARVRDAADRSARRRLLSLANPLVIKVPLLNPDRLLAAGLRRLGWIFSPGFFLAWCCVGLYAAYLVASRWNHVTASAAVIFDRENWFRLAAAWAVLKVLHETAHGLACKKYGGHVPAAGVMLILFAPLAYIDVTCSWRFRAQRQRIVTAAAGMYVELFVAALAVIVWSNASPGLLQHLAFNVAVTASVSTLLFNANPLVRFDGYFILSDLLNIPNLYPCSQQWLRDGLQQYVLGRATAAPAWPVGSAWIIRAYAVGSLAWRVVFFLTLALSLVGLFSYLGLVLAIGLLGLSWGLPVVQTIRCLALSAGQQPVERRRLALAGGLGLVAAAAALFLLLRPACVTAPAVVEYSPLTVIRAATPGFVRHVCAHNGDRVQAGQPLVMLENEELQADLAELRLKLESSQIQSRVDYHQEELAKCQVEAANQQSLAKKIAQLQERIDALCIRAPAAGRVLARNLDHLPGMYLQAGAEVAVLGSETAKELVVAVAQDDVDLFAAHVGPSGEVRARTSSGAAYAGRLVQVNPRGNTELPHPALAAQVGGPLAVKVQPAAKDREDEHRETYELLAPRFIAKVAFAAEPSRQIHAGQLATVSFRSGEESVAGRLMKSLQAWVTRLTSPRSGK